MLMLIDRSKSTQPHLKTRFWLMCVSWTTSLFVSVDIRQVWRHKRHFKQSMMFLEMFQICSRNKNYHRTHRREELVVRLVPERSVRLRKTAFLSHLKIETIILPRQARGKHRENSKKDAVFRTAAPQPGHGLPSPSAPTKSTPCHQFVSRWGKGFIHVDLAKPHAFIV